MAGFFGKLPSKGDFINRDLPRSLQDPMENWFREGLQDVKQTLGDEWFGLYQVMPIWSFYLSAGVAGDKDWVGVWIPSADRVNRSFPFLLAAEPLGPVPNIYEFMRYAEWLIEAGDLAVSALESDDFESMCEAFEGSKPWLCDVKSVRPESELDNLLDGMKLSNTLEVLIRHFDSRLARIERLLDSSGGGNLVNVARPEKRLALAEEDVGLNLVAGGEPANIGAVGIESGYCIWHTDGSEDVEHQLVITDGLPDANEFVKFLKGF